MQQDNGNRLRSLNFISFMEYSLPSIEPREEGSDFSICQLYNKGSHVASMCWWFFIVQSLTDHSLPFPALLHIKECWSHQLHHFLPCRLVPSVFGKCLTKKWLFPLFPLYFRAAILTVLSLSNHSPWQADPFSWLLLSAPIIAFLLLFPLVLEVGIVFLNCESLGASTFLLNFFTLSANSENHLFITISSFEPGGILFSAILQLTYSPMLVPKFWILISRKKNKYGT